MLSPPLRAILFDGMDRVLAALAERDIQAAHAAEMPGLVATYGYPQPDEDWRAWGGDGVIHSPIDLLPWLEHSGRL